MQHAGAGAALEEGRGEGLGYAEKRDWQVDGGIEPLSEDEAISVRERAARAIQAVFAALDFPAITDEEVEAEMTAAIAALAARTPDGAQLIESLAWLGTAIDQARSERAPGAAARS